MIACMRKALLIGAFPAFRLVLEREGVRRLRRPLWPSIPACTSTPLVGPMRFAELIGAVRSALDEGRAAEAPSVPGKRPYVKEGAVPLAPKYAESCRRCGRCVEACPVEAVDATTLKTDKGTCIACMGCVAVCPDRARTVNGLLVKAAALAIKKQEGGRKEAELFSVA